MGTQWVEEEHNILLPAFRQVANQSSFSQSYSITLQSSWKVLSFCSGYCENLRFHLSGGSSPWEVLSVQHCGWNDTIFNWESYSPASYNYRTCEKIGHKVCNHRFLVSLSLRSFLLIQTDFSLTLFLVERYGILLNCFMCEFRGIIYYVQEHAE